MRGEMIDKLLSIDSGELIQRALEDAKALEELTKLVNSSEYSVKVRALQVLSEIIPKLPAEKRRSILDILLSSLLENLFDENRRVQELSLRVLSALITEVSLFPEEALEILKAVSIPRLLEDDFVFLGFVEIFKRLKFIKYHPSVLTTLNEMTLSKDERIRVLGVWGLWRLLNSVVMGVQAAEILEKIISKIPSLMESLDETVVEVTLQLVKEIVAKYRDSGNIIRRVIPWIKEMKELKKSGSWLIRSELENAIQYLSEVVRDYYSKRINEALKLLEELVEQEKYEDALFIAGLIGNDDILRWISQKINLSKKREVIDELPRIVRGPKYATLPLNLQEKTLYIPSLGSLTIRRRKISGENEEKEIGFSERSDKVNESSKIPGGAKILEKLRSTDPTEVIDGIWELYELSKNITPENVEGFLIFVPELIRIFSSSRNEWVVDKVSMILAKILAYSSSRSYLSLILNFLVLEGREKIKAMRFFKYYFSYKWDKEAWAIVWEKLKELLMDKNTSIEVLGMLNNLVDVIPREEKDVLEKINEVLENLKIEKPGELQEGVNLLKEKINKKLKEEMSKHKNGMMSLEPPDW